MIAQPSVLQPADGTHPARAGEELPRGAEILIRSLIREGVDSIFGYPGGAVLHIYDELWRFRDRVTH
jgi:TPP-dependent indolepyruvate ferredoxin oxidoreductase alpha subunit